MEQVVKTLLLASLLFTAFMTGLIWFVQVVHYPGFQKVGVENFTHYHHFHTTSTGMVVVVPMIIELVLAVLMVSFEYRSWIDWLALGLVGGVWLLTFVWIVPLHHQLGSAYSAEAARKLVSLNLIRTLLWTAKLSALFYLCLKEFKVLS